MNSWYILGHPVNEGNFLYHSSLNEKQKLEYEESLLTNWISDSTFRPGLMSPVDKTNHRIKEHLDGYTWSPASRLISNTTVFGAVSDSTETIIEVDTKVTGNEFKMKEPAVANSVEDTLAQRGSRYGDFTDHAAVCQDLKRVMLCTNSISGRGFARLSDVQKQALEVIVDKVARILTGDPNYDDNWHDIQGYAKLVEDRLPCNVEKRAQEEFNSMSPQQQSAMKNLESAVFYGNNKQESN